MFWEWLYSYGRLATVPTKRYVSHHTIFLVRTVLFSGDFLLLIFLLNILFNQYNRAYAFWIAASATVLSLLFVCAIMSTLLKGYWHYHDRQIELAIGGMFLIALMAFSSALFH